MKASFKEEVIVGHKAADSSFYGYQSHIATIDKYIITTCVVASGGQNGEKYLPSLYEKTKTGIEVDTIISEDAYSRKIFN